MELDDLKSEWNSIQPIAKSEESLLLMLEENKHPVLKSIRLQIMIEVTAWLLFLLCYYSMFDGETKPFLVNLFLIIALLLPIGHSLYGYHYNKYLTNGANIKIALDALYIRLKTYAFYTILTRIGFVCGLLLFFTYGIYFTTTKYLLLVCICMLFLIQLFFLYRLWKKRIRLIQELIETLNNVK